MKTVKKKNLRKERRHARVRAVIFGTANRPRLSVTRSNRNIYLQVIDDERGRTLIASSTGEAKEDKKKEKKTKSDAAYEAGLKLAEKAKVKGIGAMVFDRRHYKYHGRIRRVAEALREKGIKI